MYNIKTVLLLNYLLILINTLFPTDVNVITDHAKKKTI